MRIVQHGPGCQWRETVHLFTEHRETYSACALKDDQLETGFGTRLTYFFVPSVANQICASPGSRTGAGLAVGAERTFTCVDEEHDVRTTGTVTFLGELELTVGEAPALCRNIRVVTVLSGSTSGVATRELCTVNNSGLVVREKRSVGVSARSAFIGQVSYTETADFSLLSFSPLG